MGNFRPLFRRYFRHFLTGNTSLKLPMTGFEVGSSIVWINLSANCATARVTRFGEISPLWQNFKSLWAIFLMVHLLFCKVLVQLWHFYAIGQIVIVVNGQRLNSYIATWSQNLQVNLVRWEFYWLEPLNGFGFLKHGPPTSFAVNCIAHWQN